MLCTRYPVLNEHACTLEKLEEHWRRDWASTKKQSKEGHKQWDCCTPMEDTAQCRLGSSHSEAGGDKLHMKEDCWSYTHQNGRSNIQPWLRPAPKPSRATPHLPIQRSQPPLTVDSLLIYPLITHPCNSIDITHHPLSQLISFQHHTSSTITPHLFKLGFSQSCCSIISIQTKTVKATYICIRIL